MILYHGSNVAIEKIELEKSKPYKDFGKGFYLSENEEQAIEIQLSYFPRLDYLKAITQLLP